MNDTPKTAEVITEILAGDGIGMGAAARLLASFHGEPAAGMEQEVAAIHTGSSAFRPRFNTARPPAAVAAGRAARSS